MKNENNQENGLDPFGRDNERSTFSGKLGYVLAVAGSAVGLGNIWRFPYLAAKYGGGIFLLVYLILMVTFGYVLIVSETTLGRMTRKSPVGAFSSFGKSVPFKIGGWVNAIIPMLIIPYYSVIGGWVFKYLFEYLRGSTDALAEDSYFTSFITAGASVEVWFLIFSLVVLLIIVAGVEHGIEKVSKMMMPVLVILAIIVSIYSVTRPGALEGVKYFLIPNFNNFSWMTVVAAMGQMFYSLSIAMGILYTYGSYMKKDVDIEQSTSQIEIFDTAIAFLAGLMIIPAVFSFFDGDPEKLQAGPSLMFITLPKVFASMGMGRIIGIVFFLLVLLAALTSAISLAESCVSTIQDQLGWKRNIASVVIGIIIVALGSLSALGFGMLDFVQILGMGVLDFFDFLTNSLMMPIAALSTCILIVYVIGVDKIVEEVEQSSKFKRKGLYKFFIKYLAPICILVILVSSLASVFGLIKF
ncbi:MAG: sodium-dependent transporter [Catonella sp.]|uniref:sodium-dependent transporter n=1 Tax=Catonella sp. TaxID=2382125 RepID=UPI003F9FAA05